MNILTIVNKGLSLTIVNEELSSLTKKTNFIKTIVFEKNYMLIYLMLSHMQLKNCGGAKAS